MLNFFRKYQWYFFLVITVVIIISFTFFGTYSAMQSDSFNDPVAFVDAKGNKIKQSELETLVRFLSTHVDDDHLYQGAYGPNFLNDGVIQKDFMETGLATLLAEAYANDLQKELSIRSNREKRWRPYVHPAAQFIKAQSVWETYAPNIPFHLDKIKKGNDSFDTRVELYQAERRFPSTYLRGILLQQQEQFPWIQNDPSIRQSPLTLFDYASIEDWFGSKFVRLVAQYIINSARIAEQKGYIVTKEEAAVDLLKNAEVAYQRNQRVPNLYARNSNEYMETYLRKISMDRSQAVALWQKVMLYRRMFHDIGNAIVVDPITFKDFNAYSNESLRWDLYQLPEEFRFNTFRDLQKFEIYLDGVLGNKKGSLELPDQLRSIEEIAKDTPELIQKKYRLEVAELNKDHLQTKVGVKDTWEWQVQDENWKKLQKEFPEIGVSTAKTSDERFKALDHLDDVTRRRVDSFTRAVIVDQHPEWINDALEKVQSKEMLIGLSTQGGQPPLAGIQDKNSFRNMIDEEDLLNSFTPDDKMFYRIRVIERYPNEEILTFSEANREGILDELLNKKLAAHYKKIRDDNPTLYKFGTNDWKPLEDVKDLVASQYFSKVLDQLRTEYAPKAIPETPKKQLTNDRLANLRFFGFVNRALENIKNDKTEHVLNGEERSAHTQWLLAKDSYTMDRKTENLLIDTNEAFKLEIDSWTKVFTPMNGDLSFLQLKEKWIPAEKRSLTQKVHAAHMLLSRDVQKTFGKQLLKQMQQNGNISLEYLKRKSGETESE